ncbi:MAG: Holliday junction resolvase RecU [Clostridia bacterium]|nr:Holliday junction resolvase RecU [Clostridia bacterium]
MAYFKSTSGLRGSELEDMINMTNDLYLKQGLGVIQKIPTPITPVEMDKEHKKITLAYFEKKSTVDYIGVAQGVPIAFDAKETNLTSMPLNNIHDHQVEFMKEFQKQKGISFFIFYYKKVDKVFLVPLDKYLELVNSSDKKSISYKMFDEKYEMKIERLTYINYLNKLNNFI